MLSLFSMYMYLTLIFFSFSFLFLWILKIFCFCCVRQCSPAGVFLTTLVGVCYKIALLFERLVVVQMKQKRKKCSRPLLLLYITQFTFLFFFFNPLTCECPKPPVKSLGIWFTCDVITSYHERRY